MNSRARTTSPWPARDAAHNDVWPCPGPSTCTPADSRARTTSTWPFSDAASSGVSPIHPTTSSFTRAPADNRVRTTSTWPARDATYSGGGPGPGQPTCAPADSKARTTSTWPARDATYSGGGPGPGPSTCAPAYSSALPPQALYADQQGLRQILSGGLLLYTLLLGGHHCRLGRLATPCGQADRGWVITHHARKMQQLSCDPSK